MLTVIMFLGSNLLLQAVGITVASVMAADSNNMLSIFFINSYVPNDVCCVVLWMNFVSLSYMVTRNTENGCQEL